MPIEKKEIIEAKYDWIPGIGEWLSEKLGKVEYIWTYEIDLGESGEIRMVTFDDLGEDKSEVTGRVMRKAINGGIRQDTIEVKGYKIHINANIKKWT